MSIAAILQAEEAHVLPTLRYSPHVPTKRQAQFLDLDAREALYGGAAGGGKTDCALMGALQYVHIPGYSAILFRRTYPELIQPSGLIPRALSWLGRDMWREKDKSFHFPNGARLAFGHLHHEMDKYNYHGGEFQFIGFDELTHFTESLYVYLFSRLRRPDGGSGNALGAVPLRMRSFSNPGGIGHDWVKRRFVQPGSNDRPFVPALLDDNPHIDRDGYRSSLAKLDATTREQLEHGVWERDSGGLIYPYGDANLTHWLPPLEDQGYRFVIGVDLGTREDEPTTAFCVCAWHPHLPGVFIVSSEREAGLTPHTTAERLVSLRKAYPGAQIVVDEGGLGGGYTKDFVVRWKLPAHAAQKRDKLGYRKELRGALEQNLVQIYEPDNIDLIEEMGTLHWNEEGTDNEKGARNHLTDALLYAWRRCRAYQSSTPEEHVEDGSPEALKREQEAIWERRRQAMKPKRGGRRVFLTD